ncbi:MAG: SHOCT domain-containing protein [Chloroflexota bacterium]
MNLKKIISSLSIAVIASIWLGFMISVTGGVFYPPLNKIAKPFVCLNGDMQVDEQHYNPAPGESVTTLTWYCVDDTGARNEIPTLKLGLFAIPIYALIVFFPILFIVVIWQLFVAPRRVVNQQAAQKDAATNQIKRMLDSGRIDQQQYDLMTKSAQDFLDRKAKGEPRHSNPPVVISSGNWDLAGSSSSGREAEELKKLKGLLDSGLITQQDYDNKKAEILKRL